MAAKVTCTATLKGSLNGRLDPGWRCHYRAVSGTNPPRCRVHGGISPRHWLALNVVNRQPEAVPPKVRILHDYEGEWCRVELNGEEFCEDHRFDEHDVVELLRKLGAEVERKEVRFDESGKGYTEVEVLDA